MRLSELIRELGLRSGRAWSDHPEDPAHLQEDPEVWLVDVYGGKRSIGEVRLDFAPQSLSEADEDVRHPVVELYSIEEET